MLDNTGKIVIIEHPALYDAFVLALIMHQTNETVRVLHWHSRTRDWSDEPKRRKITAVKRILASKGALDAFQLQAIHESIQAAQDDFIKEQKQVRTAFYERVLKMELP